MSSSEDGGSDDGNQASNSNSQDFDGKTLMQLEELRKNNGGSDTLDTAINNRTISHREPLEKALTGSTAKQLTLKELDKLEKECLVELSKSDKLFSVLQKLQKSREKKGSMLKDSVESSRSKNYTVKHWKSVLEKCQKELPKNDETIKKAIKKLENRQKSHRLPLASAVDEADSLPLRKLDLLEKRCGIELNEDDQVLTTLRKAIKKREKSHKEPMVREYTKMMNSKSLKQISVVKYSKFLKIVEKELPADDPFVSQVKAAQEAIVQDKADPSSSKVKTISRRGRKREKKVKDIESGVPESRSSKSESAIVAFFSAFKEDISGVNDSSMYKVVLISIFLLYGALMFYSMQLTLAVSPVTWENMFGSPDAGADGESQDMANPPANLEGLN